MTESDRVRWLDRIKPHDGPIQKWSLSVRDVPAEKLPSLSPHPRVPLIYDTLLVSASQDASLQGTVVSIGAVSNDRPVSRGMAAILYDSGAIDLVREYVIENQPRRDDVKMFNVKDVEVFKIGPNSGDPENSSLVRRFDSFLELVDGRELSPVGPPRL